MLKYSWQIENILNSLLPKKALAKKTNFQHKNHFSLK